MVNPLLYDFRRTLTSKSVLITIAVLILISFAVIPSIFGIGGGGGFNSSSPPSVVSYYDNGAYHFITYATNQFGQGVSGYVTTINMTTPSGQASIGSGTTNSTGYASFSINAPQNGNNTFGLTVQYPGGSGTASIQGTNPFRSFNGTEFTPVPSGVVVSLFGGNGFATVTDSTNSSISDVQIFYVAVHGNVPSGYTLYYKFINSTTGPGTGGPFSNQYNQSQMQQLGTLTGYSTIFPPPTDPSGHAKGSYFVFELFYPNTTLAQSQIYLVDQLYAPPAPPIQTTSLVSAFFAGIFGIFIPLVAIIGSYNSYGKDRVTGVLESVLSKPVTRRGLSISRYLSTFAGMAVAIIIAIAVVDGLIYFYGHAFVDSTILLASTGAFLVDLAAFVGIMMLLSHLIKSSGALIGIGIGLFILLDFFWSLIAFGIAYVTKIGFGTPAYTQLTIALQFLNPAQFVSLVITFLTGSSGGTFGGTFITPSQYGITIPTLVATGILWIAIPFAIYLYLATKRD